MGLCHIFTKMECAYMRGYEKKRETICTGSTSGTFLSITEPFLNTQPGAGPTNTEIKRIQVLLLRTLQSDGGG